MISPSSSKTAIALYPARHCQSRVRAGRGDLTEGCTRGREEDFEAEEGEGCSSEGHNRDHGHGLHQYATVNLCLTLRISL